MMQTKILPINPLPGSFKDPSGEVFKKNGGIYRRINFFYRDHYDFFIKSGLFKSLVDDRLLINHREIEKKSSLAYYLIIKPEMVPFISYPYEWCFTQLKQAALTTLQIQKRALKYDMSLKDCSAYNIQFLKGKPILIDTLSFEKYNEGKPWVGYRQFCQHFLAPLALMGYKDLRAGILSRVFLDGIPLDLTSSLLPYRTYINFGLLTHIHLHAGSRRSNHISENKNQNVKRLALLGLLDSLESTVKNLKYSFKGSVWGDYYSDLIYKENSFRQKKEFVEFYLRKIQPKTVWDLGANTGVFSRIAGALNIQTISFDSDREAVEKNYLQVLKNNEENILPLVMDITSPSPSIGWGNKEKESLFNRGPADMVLALALIHHLAIANNLPLEKIAKYFSSITKGLIIEFVPKNDPNVKKMLTYRQDIFKNYDLENFTGEFKRYFNIKISRDIKNTQRKIFLMENKHAQ